ncbi:hypothetical protein ACFPK1_03635 [Actinomycetospora rhizophila]|uniref:Uncharacterized protein n=1 Tax=Actinomycetospora rhizophila TaxID=1416876 RepID=A0ABV9Z8M4_9PSEU
MTAPQEAGGQGLDHWLDMSRYPDTDPDTVLSPDDQGLLTSALAVDDGALPDSVWEHMLAVVTGGDVADDAADDPVGEDPAPDDPADDAWAADPGHDVHDPADPAVDDGAGHEVHDWDAGWDGGTV